MKKINYLIILIALSFCISCEKQTNKVIPVLKQAEAIMEEHPDSALVLLEGISNTNDLNNSLKNKHSLLLIEAKDKCYKDITSDTLIFKVLDYYRDIEDNDMISLSAFYCGRVFEKQKEYEKALKAYEETQKYLEDSNDDNNLKGLVESHIGDVCYSQLLYDKAIVHYKRSQMFFYYANKSKNEMLNYNLLGNCFLLKQEVDSASYYYDKALEYSSTYGTTEDKVGILYNIGVSYERVNDYSNANKYIKKAYYITSDSLIRSKLSCEIVRTLIKLGKTDSAINFFDKSLLYMPVKKDDNLMALIYKTWSTVEEKRQNYQLALEKYKGFTNSLTNIFKENRNRAIIEIEEKYNNQLLKNKNKELVISKQRLGLLLEGTILFLIILVLLWYRSSFIKERNLKEAEHKINQLNLLNFSYNAKEKSSRNIILKHFNILKKTALISDYLRNEEQRKRTHFVKKINEIVYGNDSFVWEPLYETLNHLNNGFFDKIKNEFSELDQLEHRICCLLYVGFSNQEIATILNLSDSTVSNKRNSIRKKIGIKAYGNIYDFLKEL